MLGNTLIVSPRILDYELFTSHRVKDTPASRGAAPDHSTKEEWFNIGERVDDLLTIGASSAQRSADLLPIFNHPLYTGVKTDILFVWRRQAQDYPYKSVGVVVKVYWGGMLQAAAVKMKQAEMFTGESEQPNKASIGLLSKDLPDIRKPSASDRA